MAAYDKAGQDHTIDIHENSENSKCKKCIFRVPNVLRRQNPEAYTPNVVSIGPFHHYRRKKEGNREKDFQLIERVKQSYLKEILERMNGHGMSLEGLKSEGEFERRAREFYAEPLHHIPSKDFTEMMIVDGCFLIQLFRKYNHQILRAFDDPVFNMDCMLHFLCHDILLLENQLPWFVIHSLYNLTHILYPSEASLSILILEAFSTLPSLKQSCSSYKNHLGNKRHLDGHFLHILDLLRSSIVVPLRMRREPKPTCNNKDVHASLLQAGLCCPFQKKKDVHAAVSDPDRHQIRTATDLSKADIKFESVTKDSIMDIEFERGRYCWNGILKIPQLNIGMSSETLFRNFIAIEQCYHGYLNEITSYAILMDNLISSKEDMELLCKKKVIGNWMSDEDGCKFFSNLYKDIPHNKFYYVDLCKDVNDCYNLKWYEWLALLKSEKFSNPWRILAFGIGIIILILTAWSQTNNIRVNMHKHR